MRYKKATQPPQEEWTDEELAAFKQKLNQMHSENRYLRTPRPQAKPAQTPVKKES